MKRWTVRWTVISAFDPDDLHWDYQIRSKTAKDAIAQIRYEHALPSNVKVVAFPHH